MKIKIEIEISGAENWGVDWESNADAELAELSEETRYALYKYIGGNLKDISVKSELLQN